MFKILIVDDDRDFSKALETFLSRNGYEVCYAYDAEKAYDEIYKNVFDLIIFLFSLLSSNYLYH